MTETTSATPRIHGGMDPATALAALSSIRVGNARIEELPPSERNPRRASFTVDAVLAYAKCTLQDGEPVAQVVSDLICDLLHLADLLTPEEADEDGDDSERIGQEATLERALMHYRDEHAGIDD